MTEEIQDEYTPKVSVQLNRFENRDEVLVTVIGDPDDDEAYYYSQLCRPGIRVGFELDPLNCPAWITISVEGAYGGKFIHLGQSRGAFLASPPKALVDLLFADEAAEVVYPCDAVSGLCDLSFELPEGRSILSLFSDDPLPPLAGYGCHSDADRYLNLVTA